MVRNGRAGGRLTVLALGALLVAGCLAPGAFAQQRTVERDTLQVTYVANEGFLVAAGETKVLVDAVFRDTTITYADVPSIEVLDAIRSGRPPFDGVDLLLVTHLHRDHANPLLLADYLAAHPDVTLAGPEPVVRAVLEQLPLLGRQLATLRSVPDTPHDTTLAGVSIRAFPIPHSPYWVTDAQTGEKQNRHEDVVNLGIAFAIGGQRVFHGGDAGFKSGYDRVLARHRFDLLFLDAWALKRAGQMERNLGARARHLVLMHLPQDKSGEELRALADSIGAVIFDNPLDTRLFP